LDYYEAGDFKSADVKKLHIGAYYRAKLDYSNRLQPGLTTFFAPDRSTRRNGVGFGGRQQLFRVVGCLSGVRGQAPNCDDLRAGVAQP